MPTNATLEVLRPGKESLWTGAIKGPILTFALPQSLLAANRLGPVELAFVASGAYDSAHFLVFPVIPPPWGPSAFRSGSESSLAVLRNSVRLTRLVVTPRSTVTIGARRLTTGSAFVLFAIAVALYLRGATRADPGIAAAREDLELVSSWRTTGRISDLASDPSHLPKPGYLAYLRMALPSRGSDADENRRFLYLNAVWILLGIGAASLSLGLRFGPTSASCFLLLVLACIPLRDSADYINSEPVATGLALLVAAGAIYASGGAISDKTSARRRDLRSWRAQTKPRRSTAFRPDPDRIGIATA